MIKSIRRNRAGLAVFGFLLISLGLSLFAPVSIDVFAEETTQESQESNVINLNELPQAKRTREEVAAKLKSADELCHEAEKAGIFSTEPIKDPVSEMVAGELKERALKAWLAKLNFYRWLVGAPEIPAITGGEDYQSAALLMSRADTIDHVIQNIVDHPKNADVPESFKNKALKAGHNVLSYGSGFFGCIKSYISEGKNNGTVAHRWILFGKEAELIKLGFASSVSIGGIKDWGNNTNADITCFPSPGNFPLEGALHQNSTYWHVDLRGTPYEFVDHNDINIKVTIDGKTQSLRPIKDSYGSIVEAKLGLDFLPQIDGSLHNKKIDVEIVNGLEKNGETYTLKYSSSFFDPKDVDSPDSGNNGGSNEDESSKDQDKDKTDKDKTDQDNDEGKDTGKDQDKDKDKDSGKDKDKDKDSGKDKGNTDEGKDKTDKDKTDKDKTDKDKTDKDKTDKGDKDKDSDKDKDKDKDKDNSEENEWEPAFEPDESHGSYLAEVTGDYDEDAIWAYISKKEGEHAYVLDVEREDSYSEILNFAKNVDLGRSHYVLLEINMYKRMKKGKEIKEIKIDSFRHEVEVVLDLMKFKPLAAEKQEVIPEVWHKHGDEKPQKIKSVYDKKEKLLSFKVKDFSQFMIAYKQESGIPTGSSTGGKRIPMYGGNASNVFTGGQAMQGATIAPNTPTSGVPVTGEKDFLGIVSLLLLGASTLVFLRKKI